MASSSYNETLSSTASDSMAASSSETPLNSVFYSVDPTSSKKPALYSASSSPDPTKYDVFLSFYGKDTRHKFTAHLYAALHRHGIRTFMDDPELPAGDVIKSGLSEAIENSKIYVVIFSKNYAYSSWCLDELVQIYRCYETMKRLVICVYCNIEPLVVRHNLKNYGKALTKHETYHFKDRLDIVNKWRTTLTNVAGFSGKLASPHRSEPEIIDEIVDVILLKINPKTLRVAKYPVGLDSRVNDITTLLSRGTEEGVIKFGIYGMGGVGKTTFAKALYNQLLLRGFKDSCFLANVKEVWETTKGQTFLQQQLINGVLKSKTKFEAYNIDEGTELIKARLSSTKVLVVVDDLGDHKQFESLVVSFAPGSVVIITTRFETILDEINVKPKYRYRVNELDEHESRALFTQHAFKNSAPNNSFMVLINDILHLAGGLPLALEIFGSYLFTQQTEAGWESYIDKLQRDPDRNIEKILISSLDAVEWDDPMLKKMFLDIACFFIGYKKEEVVKIMETYYSYVDHKIDILKKRCLLTINDGDELRMHDLVRDMGRKIARNNSPDEPQKHSRLWAYKEICAVLKIHKGTEAIEVIMLSSCPRNFSAPEGPSFSTKTFKRMSKLRFLRLKKVNFTGSFEDKFQDLRWLRWEYCSLESLPYEFYPQKLVFLALPYSEMRTLWELGMASHVFEMLKTLDMSNSRYLVATPDFTKLPCLQTLNFEGCKSLEEVHISIGSLVWLFSLNLCDCGKLICLPDSISNLRALKYLDVRYCCSLKALPLELGNIESLEKLKTKALTILELPDSIGRLTNLVELKLKDNKQLKTLPDSICNLIGLRVLNIDGCSGLEALPLELGNIGPLEEFAAQRLTISKLPDSIGRLVKLVSLRLGGNTNLDSLPETICNLRALELIDISDCCKIEAFPEDLGNIESLTKFIACGLNISKLPDSFRYLTNLFLLDLSNNRNLQTLPDTFCELRSLESLDLTYCHNLSSIATLPPALKVLKAEGCTSLKKLPNLSNLKQLLLLIFKDCSGLNEIQLGFEQLASLKELHVGGCNSALLKYTCTKHFFEMCSKFNNGIKIHTSPNVFPDWIIRSSDLSSIVSINYSPPSVPSRLALMTTLDRIARILARLLDGNSPSDRSGSTMSLDLLPHLSHNFMAIILCFNVTENNKHHVSFYSVKNAASGYIFSDFCLDRGQDSWMAILPRSIFPVSDSDDRIELTTDAEICGIHLLYKLD